MNFELHYDLISGCTMNFSLGGAIVVFFLDWGCNCFVAPLATVLEILCYSCIGKMFINARYSIIQYIFTFYNPINIKLTNILVLK